tara:strand:- start:693 stop:1589 length:897 start_codon:yes stop_codon:yes gene_type:complete
MTNKKRNRKAARAARKKRKKDAAAEDLLSEVEKNWNPYAKNWSKHADHFRLTGYYDWMASFLKQFHRVFEIGTGDGSGTVALARNGSTVVSVDHNPKCQDIAEVRLASAGISTTRERRGKINSVGQGYRMTYSKPMSMVIDGEVLLLEGDVGNDHDTELSEWLLSSPKFDAIACWNIGTYTALHQSFGTPQEYRLRTQNVTYELAECILRPGGVLHIIDRGQTPTDSTRATCIEGLLECHRDQASVTSLLVDSKSVEARQFVQPSEDTGIVMKRKDDTDNFQVEAGEMAFWSIIARKP